MNPIEPAGLRAHLLDVEPPNVERLRSLQQELQAVFIQQLTRGARAARIVSIVVSLVFAAFGWFVASHVNADDKAASPTVLRIIWTIFTFAMLATALRSAVILSRGHVDLRDAPKRSRVLFTTNVFIAVLLIVQAVTHPSFQMMGWALFGMLWVIVAAVKRVSAVVEASELATREMLLRLELRLAENGGRR